MDERAWQEGNDPGPMLAYLRAHGPDCERSWRLFACGCCRLMDRRGNVSGLTVVELAERVADGLLPLTSARGQEQRVHRLFADAWALANGISGLAGPFSKKLRAWQTAPRAALLRCIFGNPFRPLSIQPGWLAWNNALVARLAQAAYDQRLLPLGTLDPDRLAVLADALEESGCGDTALLGHLRGPGPHVRGCHVVDALLAR